MMRRLERVMLPLAILTLFALAVGVLWVSRHNAGLKAGDLCDPELAATGSVTEAGQSELPPTPQPRPRMDAIQPAIPQSSAQVAPLCVAPTPA